MVRRMADANLHVFVHDLLNAYTPPFPQRHVPPHETRPDAVVPPRHVLRRSGIGVELQPRGGRPATPHADATSAGGRTLRGRHYVDDFNGIEYAEHSDSAFHAFSEFFHVLGLRVKDSKAQPPANRHVF